MIFLINSLVGVGEISFGMTPEDVRRKIGGDCRSFMRSPKALFPCDYFEKIGAFFYYDSSGHLEAVEFSGSARPIVDGVDLLSLTFQQAVGKLTEFDQEVEAGDDWAIAYQLGVSVYAPMAKDDRDAPVESVLAFRAGYYN